MRYEVEKFLFGPLKGMMADIDIVGPKSEGKWRADISKREEYNIAFFGCSFTYGWGVTEEESWPYKLCKLLGDKVQCWNFGIPGTSLDLIVKLALKVQQDLNPDLIILWWPEIHRRLWFQEGKIDMSLPWNYAKPAQWMLREGWLRDKKSYKAEHEALTILSNYSHDYNHALTQVALLNKIANRCINIFSVEGYDRKFKKELSKYYGIEEVIDCLLCKDYKLSEIKKGDWGKRWVDWDRDGRWGISKKDMHPNPRWHNRFANHLNERVDIDGKKINELDKAEDSL